MALFGVKVASLEMLNSVFSQLFSTDPLAEQWGHGSDVGLFLSDIGKKVSHVFLHLLQIKSYDGIFNLNLPVEENL